MHTLGLATEICSSWHTMICLSWHTMVVPEVFSNMVVDMLRRSILLDVWKKISSGTLGTHGKNLRFEKIFKLVHRPFPIALSTVLSTFLSLEHYFVFEHPYALFRTLGNIWAIFLI